MNDVTNVNDETRDVATETKTWPQRWAQPFLEALSECGSVTHAARAAGCGRRTSYDLRKRDAEFAQAWEAALQEAVGVLVDEAKRRAYEGVNELVHFKGQIVWHWTDADGNEVEEGTPGARKVPLVVRKYSDDLLKFLISGIDPRYKRDASVAIHNNLMQSAAPVQVFLPDNERENAIEETGNDSTASETDSVSQIEG